MPRNYHRREQKLKTIARKQSALNRNELRAGSADRVSAASPTSFAVKARDPGVADQVAAFLAARREGNPS